MQKKKKEKREAGFYKWKGETDFQKRKERGAREREWEREIDPFSWIRPASFTRLQQPIPATSSAKLGIDLKLERRRSYPCCHRHWKTARTSAIKAWKTCGSTRFCRRRYRRILAAPPPRSCSSIHTHHFPTDHDHRGRRLGRERPPGNSWIFELRSAAVVARGRSPPAPLDSPRFELSYLSFP